MFNLKVTGPSTLPSGSHRLPPAGVAEQLARFRALVRRTVSEAKPAPGAQANVVTVQPGGRTFSTIGDALKSITDASLRKQYVVYIGAGTYNEVVTCKSWVFLSGEGPDKTIVTAPAQPDQISKGTVKGASHSAIQNLHVAATSGDFGAWSTAVDCQSVTDFDIENCYVTATDTTTGVNVIALSLDYADRASGSRVNLSYTNVVAKGGGQPIALFAASGSYAHHMEGNILSEGGSVPGSGGAAYGSSEILIENASAQGAEYCLYLNDSSKITANQCHLIGPVGPGVVVNP